MKLGPYSLPGAHSGDCRALLRELPDSSVHCCVTSPPYWGLRRYLSADAPESEFEIGAEETVEDYVATMVGVFRDVRRALRDDGVLFLNLGDSYAHGGCGARDPSRWPKQQRNDHMPRHAKRGKRVANVGKIDGKHPTRGGGVSPAERIRVADLKPKDLVGIPWRVAFALQADGWYLRSDIIWHKSAPMPESVSDRPTRAHEFVFLLTKSERYFFDAHAIRERSVSTQDQGNRAGYARPERRTVDGVHAGSADGWTREKSGGFRNARDVWSIADFGWLQSLLVDEGLSEACRREIAQRALVLGLASDVWTLGPEPTKDAHFAVMPTKLAKRCILAGTSEHGACRACGAPWRRVVDHAWEPGCSCADGGAEPCVVLDPFFGSGTTGRVAEDLGRSWLGFDLNPAYEAIQRRRTSQIGLGLTGASTSEARDER